MKLKGKVTIGKIHSSSSKKEEDYISITVEDENSSLEFFDLKMSLIDFAKATLLNRGYVPCEVELRGLENLGKTLETEHISIFIPKAEKVYVKEQFFKLAREAARAFETDGWKVSDRALEMNHHYISYRDGGVVLKSSRYRYV